MTLAPACIEMLLAVMKSIPNNTLHSMSSQMTIHVWGARVPAIVRWRVISPAVRILSLVNEESTQLVTLMLCSSFRSLIRERLTKVA